MATAKPFYKITLLGIKQAEAYLLRQIKKLSDMREPLHAIAKDFYEIEKQWFDSEGGGRWKPLSPGYAAWKAKAYPGRKILQRSRRMYREFTGATSNYEITGGHKLVIMQSGVPYWMKHEDGDPKTNLPRREVLSPYLLKRQEHWHDLVTKYLSEKMFG
jgi:hypothetical protein